MPFTVKSRKAVETPLEAEYKKHIAWHARDKDATIAKYAPPLRSFPLIEDDTVTLSEDCREGTAETRQALDGLDEESTDRSADEKISEPVTVAEKNSLGIFSIRV